jgi:hypothetical protein
MNKPNINSPLGRRELAMQQPGKKVLFVPDESEESQNQEFYAESTQGEFEIPKNAKLMSDPQIPQNQIVNPLLKKQAGNMSQDKDQFSRETLSKLRQESRSKKLEISPDAKNRVEFLLGLRRKTQNVVVEGVSFTLTTLKHSDYQKVFASLAGMPESTSVAVSLEVQVQTLARAITHIENNSVFDVLGVSSSEEVVECLRQFSNDVVEELYNHFLKLKAPLEVNSSEETEVRENLKK